ncbi:hypothetical protein Tco_0090124 [Tanacetum coccineum]
MATNSSAATAAARRRRIAEKGAERLALITGRTPSISSSSSSPPLPPPISDKITDSSLNKDTPSNNETVGDDVTSDEQPMLHNSEAKTETSAETSSETRDIQSFLDALTEHNPSISTSNRPLFLLLVTNITIVVAPLLLEKVKQIERRVSSTGDAGFGNNIGRSLKKWNIRIMKPESSSEFTGDELH